MKKIFRPVHDRVPPSSSSGRLPPQAETVLNRWIPGSKSGRDLTAATFPAICLTTGINAETAGQGPTVGIEEIRRRFPDRLFVPPK